jgi:hypothetical protein
MMQEKERDRALMFHDKFSKTMIVTTRPINDNHVLELSGETQ